MVLSGIWKKSEHRDLPEGLIVSHDRKIPPDDVQDICASVGWSRREPDLIARALDNSVAVVSVWDRTGVMVGFAGQPATGSSTPQSGTWSCDRIIGRGWTPGYE